jgi:hypothetical protein
MNLQVLTVAALLHIIDFALACFPGLSRTDCSVQLPVCEPDFYR